MIDHNIYRMIDLLDVQDQKYIETTIISALKEKKLSLSQVRAVFNHILMTIEDKNQVNL